MDRPNVMNICVTKIQRSILHINFVYVFIRVFVRTQLVSFQFTNYFNKTRLVHFLCVWMFNLALCIVKCVCTRHRVNKHFTKQVLLVHCIVVKIDKCLVCLVRGIYQNTYNKCTKKTGSNELIRAKGSFRFICTNSKQIHCLRPKHDPKTSS